LELSDPVIFTHHTVPPCETEEKKEIIQFKGYLLMCRLNSTSVNYKAWTKTPTQHKTVRIHKNKTLNRQNKINMAGGKECKRSTGTQTTNPEKSN